MDSAESTPIRVAVVEDDARVRASLTSILQGANDCECFGAYGNAEQALAGIARLRPAVVLMDINLPGLDGVECVRRLARIAPEMQIVVLTVHEDPDTIFNSLAAGASGYLLKPVRAAELLAAVRDVYSGGAPITSNIARKIVQSFQSAEPSVEGSENLSPREMGVLEHLAKGYLYKETADLLGISYSTVRTHVEHIYRKLHVQSRAQAVARYLGV